MTSSNAPDPQDLLQLLERETELLNELGEVMREKRDALVDNDLESLQELSETENQVARELTEVEDARAELFNEVALDLTPYLQDPSLDEFITALMDEKPDLGEQFRAAGDELRELVTELGRLNFDNLILTRNLIDYTQTLLDVLARGGSSPNYTNTGEEAGPDSDEPRRLMDHRA